MEEYDVIEFSRKEQIADMSKLNEALRLQTIKRFNYVKDRSMRYDNAITWKRVAQAMTRLCRESINVYFVSECYWFRR